MSFDSLHKLQQQLDETLRSRGAHHRETQLLRDSLAIHHCNAGEHGKADDLYRDSGICEHLKPVEDYIRSLGVRVRAMGSFVGSYSTAVTVLVRLRRAIDDLVLPHPLAGAAA